MYRFKVLEKGTTYTLHRIADLEAQQPVGTRLRVTLNFSERFKGFLSLAEQFGQSLQRLGVTPWSVTQPLVVPVDKKWYVHWVRNPVWWLKIVKILIVLAVIVYLVSWVLHEAVKIEQLARKYPVITLMLIGGVVYTIYRYKQQKALT